jgi:hypothetical protein
MKIETLQNLVQQFNANELTLIRYALKKSKEANEESKYLGLFEFIIAADKKNISRRAASLAIYHALPDTRINKLITRLWEKILDIIISENFLRKSERLNEQLLLRLRIRKKMLCCATLTFLNGDSDSYRSLLEEGIRDAEKAESNIMLIELYRLKKSTSLFVHDTRQYNFCERQISYYQKCYDLEQRILSCYNEIAKEDSFGYLKSPEKRLYHLEGIVDELNKKKKFINSVYSKELFTLIKLECLFLKENYSEAKTMLNQFLLNVGSLFIAKGKLNIAARVETELCTCELFLGNYRQAIVHIEKSLSLLWANNKMNYYISLDSLFYAVFHNKEFDRAEKVIVQFFSDENPIRNELRVTKYFHFQACVHFEKKKYKQALEIINKPLPLNKDKTGYDIAIRILRIQCFLELNRDDEASTQIENLRKHVNRNQEKTYTSERDKLIIRVLILMQKRGFTGKQNKTESELIKKLSASAGQNKWTPLGPELIPFHEWQMEFEKIR